jgi:hypothetical protein
MPLDAPVINAVAIFKIVFNKLKPKQINLQRERIVYTSIIYLHIIFATYSSINNQSAPVFLCTPSGFIKSRDFLRVEEMEKLISTFKRDVTPDSY